MSALTLARQRLLSNLDALAASVAPRPERSGTARSYLDGELNQLRTEMHPAGTAQRSSHDTAREVATRLTQLAHTLDGFAMSSEGPPTGAQIAQQRLVVLDAWHFLQALDRHAAQEVQA